MPRGVTWSKSMSIHGNACRGNGGRDGIETAGGKIKNGVYLFPADVELVDYFLYAGSGFKVFEHGGDGHSGIAKHPCTA